MEIENNNINLNVKLSLKEVRVMEYALRKAKEINGIDVLLSNIDEMIGEFRKLLNDNWVAPIQEEPPAPIIIPSRREAIDII